MRFHKIPLPDFVWRYICLRFPSKRTLAWYQARAGIQLSSDELLAIISALKLKPACRFLVFGVGNDSALWHRANVRGTTVFLEDDPGWLAECRSRHPTLSLHSIRYTSTMADSQSVIESCSIILPKLPTTLQSSLYDVILVDAPAGCSSKSPGRTQSIALANHLASPDADIFVHDCDREVERLTCDQVFGSTALVSEIGRLRHYRL
jgi:glucuronoxylan 4-O-methyltransferase